MFSIVAGSGHCGTKWLAAVLDSQPGVTWHHHLREKQTGKPWELLDLKPPNDSAFDQYWLWIREHMAKGVGDANSWPPHMLPLVDEVVPIDRVIYLTRNGVQQLHSLSATSPALSQTPLPEAAQVKLRALYDAAPNVPDKPYYEWTQFEQLCLMVAANDFMPDWLREHGLIVDEYSLEELTTDLDTLRELAPGLNDDELARWQQTDLNRKVEGDREPATLWRKWTTEQRASYKAVIG